MIFPVILSGGSGSRLWPLSREASPKQFIGLIDEHSLLENTIKRLDNVDDISSPLVVCNESHRFQVAEVFRKLGKKGDILLEPLAKNTAPALALAAFFLFQKDPESIMLVLAADHHIDNIEVFHDAIRRAKQKVIKDSSLITFGITPTCPHEGYGYIKQGIEATGGVYEVDMFVEKPSLAVAKEYVESGEYYWNSGMFMFTAKSYLEALEKLQPQIYSACKKTYEELKQDLDFVRFDEVLFGESKSESIDYAVMEKAHNVCMIPMQESGWSDVGSWDSLYDISMKNTYGNVVFGDVITNDVKNSYLRSHDRLLAAVGVDNLIVVETADAILVADKSKTQDVKKVVEVLKKQKRREFVQHKRNFRPWGYHDILIEEQLFHVKKVLVYPGEEIALQRHFHRNEQWTVLEGTAEISVDGVSKLVTENQTAYVAIGQKHSIKNIGSIPLVFIEIQSGRYINENDVERFDI
ncbi:MULTISPECIES: mannose-1-phosphate guanylyltransferase/mannose-6-phosphate isomerase [unclassified Francisella]|uniref:mannose-1-phosphate guanylyltransferase/mannose-6-phosphate isomerase n=1 Tax=unclassified Francisella TaxID=2610885 RepID=UPI002E34FF28|nr:MULTISPECIES: mannose-1-phosphate guanylyltransferase/mannose-6-phosphate isomerase [unclassified Francisella]MED7819502.1 mannose-1-phosphate guanylyltransferase/mannose-6-phosphate isomerase [Francisella sp. 19S2-4]MED7830291.1 mannose-1-phosphate guanylyltransferase/mannose-6-phosphate isomerase [Francisella sp. 19S2-10]